MPPDVEDRPTEMAPEAAEVIARIRAQGWSWCERCAAWRPPDHFGLAEQLA